MVPRKGLGRGLDSLIDTSHVRTAGSSSINEVRLDQIYANPDQPRRNFDEEALAELAESIKQYGVISPITVLKQADDKYMIIAGERRYRAAKIVGLQSLPAYIRSAKDEEVMEMALIENIQRQDLDAIEIALAYQRLIDDYQLSQEQMADRVGKKRATVTNYLRLLKLPADIQLGLKERKIDMGHARALLAAKEPTKQLELYKKIISEGLSVRRVEELAQQEASPKKAKTNKTNQAADDSMLAVQSELQKRFTAKVKLTAAPSGKGKIIIPFKNNSDLERILRLLDSDK